jgi:hypothetical protein
LWFTGHGVWKFRGVNEDHERPCPVSHLRPAVNWRTRPAGPFSGLE